MPTTEVEAYDWSVDQDLEGGSIYAAGFRARYSQALASGQFDDAIFSTLALFAGSEQIPNLQTVRILATLNGVQETLITGVVDRNAIALEGGGIVGELQGRDFLALLLDKYPTRFFVIPKGTTFHSAAQTIAKHAGLALTCNAPAYHLASDLVVTGDRTLAEWLDDLLAPLRWAERHRVDCWADGASARLYVQDRAATLRGSVSIPHAQAVLERMELSRLPYVADVRVLGGSYSGLVFQPVAPTVTRTQQVTNGPDQAGNPSTTTETRTVTTDDRGREFLEETRVDTSVGGGPTTTTTKSIERTFYDGFGVYPNAWEGKVAGITERGFEGITDAVPTMLKTTQIAYTPQGDPQDETVEEVSYKDTSGVTQSAVQKHTRTQYHYGRWGGQVLRSWRTQDYDPSSGAVTRDESQHESSASGQTDAQVDVVPPGYVRKTYQYAAPAWESPQAVPLRTESSPLLGSNADCQTLRALILQDYGIRRLQVRLRLPLPDLRVKPGMTLTVTGAPAYWLASSFYVRAVHMSKSGAAILQRIDGVAWVS